MKILIYPSVAEHAEAAAEFIATTVSNHGGPLGLATGSTTEPVYKQLCREYSLPKELEMFALDEYFQIEPDSPSSFRQTLVNQFVNPCGLEASNLFVPPASAVEDELVSFEANLKSKGPLSLQLLGIGRNAHIAFNEPGSDFNSKTRKVDLSETTKQDNAKFFDGEVPAYAVTQGIATIMQAERLLLLATGSSKANAIGSIFEKSSKTPAAMLREHRDVTLMLDAQAASEVPKDWID